jgi:DnaJ-class molecular chaperone
LHPDKRRKKKESLDDDHAFKELQHAYSLIGSEEARRNHDLKQRYQQLYSNSDSTHHNFRSGNSGAFHNGFAQSNNVFGSSSTVYFTFGKDGGVSFKFADGRRSGRFGSQGSHNFFNSQTVNNQQSPRPHYVQKVSIPLEVLYAGGKNVEMNLRTSVLDRYKAAYKGKLLTPILLQATFTVMMTWLRSQKVNWFLSLFLFGIMVHSNLQAAPQKTEYITNISPGWKGGTKLSFKTATEDVTFFIDEAKHEKYSRHGNDLHTHIYVSKKRLRKGCTLTLNPLDKSEAPIEIKLAPSFDGEIINIPGRGWPIANCERKSRGDLKVKIYIKRGKKKRRR